MIIYRALNSFFRSYPIWFVKKRAVSSKRISKRDSVVQSNFKRPSWSEKPMTTLCETKIVNFLSSYLSALGL